LQFSTDENNSAESNKNNFNLPNTKKTDDDPFLAGIFFVRLLPSSPKKNYLSVNNE
jgi:hypothetical protein